MNTAPTATPIGKDQIQEWADNLRGPVALHIRQALVPVEGKHGVFFPPTYAMEKKDVPYAIDELSDGTKVAQIDSVGSQANRMEPIFKKAPEGRTPNPLAELVPQIEIAPETGAAVSIFEIGHRIGDAFVRSSSLKEDVRVAFDSYRLRGDATAIAKLAPTSIVFGAWDSRGEQAKLPRIVQSVIRAWDVDVLHRSAQYGPPVNYAELDIFSEDEKQKVEGDSKNPLAKAGFGHVPAVNSHGGIVARGGIFRDVTVNLVALRQLDGKENGAALRRYILALALVAATEPQDGFLRQGCLLVPDVDSPAVWHVIGRTGQRTPVELLPQILLTLASDAAKDFGVGKSRVEKFLKESAKAEIAELKKAKPAAKKAPKDASTAD